MPRYYFGYESEGPEAEGEDLADDDAALAIAVAVSEELGRGRPVRPKISVFNENGEIVAPKVRH